ncbi:hypothetical protein [Christiangramia echinicola]|uniref:Uncharacterized protein n=1 Tax=Christiangramia echinicola TaxID=279359 RepID=A0A1H1KWS0_9FLAO|nr:hypothetical protein [Christiangramia echinicola]SDR66587.1 hypothetical protein SAMN04488552_0302 [Christiangramia echinicola]
MKNSIFKIQNLGFALIIALFFASCSEDDDFMTGEDMDDDMPAMATCDDGIMNGDETGIDCGGTCEPCTADTGRRAELYVTNNENGNISLYSVTGDSLVTFTTNATAAEGIYYDAANDMVVQASRSDMRLDAYSDISTLMEDSEVTAAYSSSADLESPRELAVNGSTYVVADNGSNKFFVYTNNGSGFSLMNTIEVPFPVWGITFKGEDLYAVVDSSSDLAVFYDFEANAMDGEMRPSKRVTIEGIVRTHGLTYDGTDDVMIMTDIGDAANGTDDGAFHVIDDFSTKFDALSDGDLLTVDMQTRVAGTSTMLGNPIDVAYDSEENAIYISEIGNGKVLGFTNIGDGGDLAPSYSMDLTSASSIYFSSDETDGNTGMASSNMMTELYVTNNSDGNITVYDGSGNLIKSVMTDATAAEGIYYSAMNDAVIQASRSGMMLENYSDFSDVMDGNTVSADFTGDAELMSPREIAVFGNKVVVSDNDMHMFYVYSYDGTSFTLENTLDPGFNVWGITFKGGDLIAVVDSSSDIAVFNDFLDNDTDGMLTPDKRITIGGIVRTHGIDYSEADDVLVLTDIGDAADANTDGGFQVIQNFSMKLDAATDGGMIAQSEQTRVAGASTLLGNPIDIAYDHKTETVFIAEVGNGKVLAFSNALNLTGDVAPDVNNDLAAASSLYLYNN